MCIGLGELGSEGLSTFDIGSRRTSAPGLAVFAAQIHGLRGASDDDLSPTVEVNKKSVSDMRKNKRPRRLRF